MERHDIGGQLARPAPVRHAFRDELGVGDDDRHVLVGDERCGARGDLAHFADGAGDLDAVSDLDRPLEQDDEPAEEVAHDVLQAETESDADGAHQHVQRRQIDPGALQDHERTERDDPVAHDGAERLPHADVEAAARQHFVDEPPRDAARHPDQRRDQRDDDEQLERGELAAGDARVEEDPDLFNRTSRTGCIRQPSRSHGDASQYARRRARGCLTDAELQLTQCSWCRRAGSGRAVRLGRRNLASPPRFERLWKFPLSGQLGLRAA